MKIAAFAPRSLFIPRSFSGVGGEVGSIFKPIALVFLVFFSLFFILKSPALAQAQQPQAQPVNSYAAPNTNPDVPNNLHNWTQNVMIEVMSAMTCQLAGIDPTNPSAKCLGVDQKTGKIGFVENGGGAIGVMGNLITMTLTPPIHTSDFIAYVSHSFGLSKPTYAAVEVGGGGGSSSPAGKSGIDSLNPIVKVWSASRNIVYLLFVLVFVIIGIAIMFRVRIDPRTVMTVQNQIPKLIIGILLVTFSFAIAGLLIDIMWITIYLFINILVSADPKMAVTAPASLVTSKLNTTPFDFAGMIFTGNNGLFGVTVGASSSIYSIIFNLFNNWHLPTDASIVGVITGGFGVFLGVLLGAIGGFVAFFIILIAILWSLFKLWFALLEAYIMILVGVIFAPFWIVTGLIPGGQSLGFGSWLREMLGNLAAFPAAIAMFIIGRILIDAFGSGYSAGQFNPPLLGNPAATDTFGPIIALGIIFTTPHIVKVTKAAFKSPKLDLAPIGQAVGIGVGAPKRLITGSTSAALDPFRNADAQAAAGKTGLGAKAPYLKSIARGFGLGR